MGQEGCHGSTTEGFAEYEREAVRGNGVSNCLEI